MIGYNEYQVHVHLPNEMTREEALKLMDELNERGYGVTLLRWQTTESRELQIDHCLLPRKKVTL